MDARLILGLWLALLPAIASAANHTIVTSGNNFSPSDLTIAVGDTVTFRNSGGGLHNARSNPGAVTSFRCANGCDGAGGNGNPSSANWSATVTFNTAGSIGYYCEIHGAPGGNGYDEPPEGIGMSGVITVTGAPAFSLSATDQYLWMVPPASNPDQQGFLRLTNRGDSPGAVSVWGLDAAGQRSSGTITLTLAAHESRQFNSQDLELGNTSKGLTGSLGDGSGDWTVIVGTDLDLEALAYIRTPDGFLTSMHDRVVGDGVDWFVPMFNPASNPNQLSRLRVINSNTTEVSLLITGTDDAGVAGASQLVLTIPALASVELSSVDLENGNVDKGLSGSLGDGTGKWSLLVSATGRVTVQTLLFDPNGYLTNLSTLSSLTPLTSGERVLWFVPPAANSLQQGFIRLINLENRSATVQIWGIDDAGQRSTGTLSFTLAANASQQLNSQDIELGNPDKGVTGSLGSGSGNWRLLVSTDLNYLPMALIRTPDGFLTSIHDLVASTGLSTVVPIFNPAENPNQVSELRLINPNASAASVTISGRDDAGLAGPGGTVSLSLAAGAAVALTSVDLESGNVGKGLTGSLGNGSGKWVLTVTASQPVKVMSLLRDPNGYLTNLSNGAQGTSGELDP